METKEQKIVAAAFRLFHQHGYRKVTMSDIAEAAHMSRPSLYASFPNKEAVFSALADQDRERAEHETQARVVDSLSLEERLSLLFEIWIIGPFASVIDSPSGLDLLGNAANYAPEAIARTYHRFEHHLSAALKPAIPRKRGMTARDLAHVLTLATQGLKASTPTLAELRRMTNGLVAMAVATARVANEDAPPRG